MMMMMMMMMTVSSLISYGCESLIPREDHRLMVFKNWVLRKVFGPKDRK